MPACAALRTLNARDAIPQVVSKLTIEPGDVEFDRNYASEHLRPLPGRQLWS